MANVYFQELKNYRNATILWALAIALLMVSSIAKFEGIHQSSAQITQLFQSLPKELSALLGVNGVDITTAEGYFVVVVLYSAIMLGIHAALLGSGIVAKEEMDHTAEFLYSKPRTRRRILSEKLLAAVTIVVILNLVTLVASLIGMDSVVPAGSVNHTILFLMPALFGIQIYFLAVGFAFASIMRRPKGAAAWASRTLLAAFVVYSFVNMSDKFGFLKYLTAFQYFDAKQIFAHHAYDPVYLSLAAATVTGLVTASFVLFQRRDLDT